MHLLFRKIPPLVAALILAHTGFGQIGVGTTAPDANAVLTVSGTSKGVLIPRLSTAEQTTLAATLAWEAASALMSYRDMQLVIAGGETSLMFPRPVAVTLRNQLQNEFPGRMNMYTASGRGHEMTNHLPTFVLVAKAALEGQGLTLPSTA